MIPDKRKNNYKGLWNQLRKLKYGQQIRQQYFISINFLILIFVLCLCKRLSLFLGKEPDICSKVYVKKKCMRDFFILFLQILFKFEII